MAADDQLTEKLAAAGMKNRRLEKRVTELQQQLEAREPYQQWRREVWLRGYLSRMEYEGATHTDAQAFADKMLAAADKRFRG